MARLDVAKIPRAKLSTFFRCFEPEYILGTTYTVSLAFFESVVFPKIDRRELRKCLVLCDQVGFQRSIVEATALRSAAREYIVATAPAQHRFHPKCWLMLRSTELALLVGSGNLTQSGFVDNVELFDAVVLKTDGPGRPFVDQIRAFVVGLRGLWKNTVASVLATETLDEITAALTKFAATVTEDGNDGSVQFLSSFDGPFPVQVRAIAGRATKVAAAAPYFGGSIAGASYLRDTLQCDSLQVFPAIHQNATLDVPIDALRKVADKVGVLRIASGEDGFAHLKLYGFVNEKKDAWMLTGSPNCSRDALTGNNVECALLRKVPLRTLDEYFRADDSAELPTQQRPYGSLETVGNLTLWATDLGDAIEMVIASSHREQLPLKDVVVEVRSGSTSETVERKSLFDERHKERIAWHVFKNFVRNSSAVRLIKISGRDCSGSRVNGAAFVDDLATLTAEPTQRAAWRATLALLSNEGSIEFGDLAALFHLVDQVADFDDDQACEEGTVTKSPAGSTNVVERDKSPIWPPVPIRADTASLISHHGSGHVFWFDRILATLINKPGVAHVVETAKVLAAEQDPEDATLTDAESELPPQAVNAALRLWGQSYDRYCALENRLWDIEIQPAQANRIYGPAALIFLATMAVRKAVERFVPSPTELAPPADLTHDFLAMIFADREQHEDFAPIASNRYGHEVFPPIAIDLAESYLVFPHHDVSGIILVAFAHLHALGKKQSHQIFTLLYWLTFRDVTGDQLAELLDDEEHLLNLWSRFFENIYEPVDGSDVREAWHELKCINWSQHPGNLQINVIKRAVKDRRACDELDDHLRPRIDRFVRAGRPVLSIERLAEACPNPKCPAFGRRSAAIAARCRELKPAICDGCGTLLVPRKLVDVRGRA